MNEKRVGPATTAVLVASVLCGAAGALFAHRALFGRKHEATYPPLDEIKPLADGIWIVDSGPISVSGLKLPIRMTLVRLSAGDLFLHSPTRYSPALARAIEALGPVRHLVAPTTAHWSYLKEWQQAYPDATTWAVPGLRYRAQVRKSGVRIDRDLGPASPPEWEHDLTQGIVAGGAGFREAYFFEKGTRTLLLADLVENLEPRKLPWATRVIMRAAGATRATTARHVRAVLRLGGRDTAASLNTMLALSPERVVFAHGTPFTEDGANHLRRAFAWIGN